MRELQVNELNSISGGTFGISVNLDFGNPAPYPVYSEVIPVLVDRYDVVTPICDRYGCDYIVDTVDVYEDVVVGPYPYPMYPY